jgi:hypothetical protein
MHFSLIADDFRGYRKSVQAFVAAIASSVILVVSQSVSQATHIVLYPVLPISPIFLRRIEQKGPISMRVGWYSRFDLITPTRK